MARIIVHAVRIISLESKLDALPLAEAPPLSFVLIMADIPST